MPDSWMSVLEAAAGLKVHTRTIERRIAGGRLQTRRTESGLLQVLIDLPDMSDTPSETALETVRELAADQVTLATGSASALVQFAHDGATRARQDLEIARQDVRRGRIGAVVAWCVVAGMGIGVTIAVGWTAQKITRANEDVRHLTDYTQQMEAQMKQLQQERDAARQAAQLAQIQGAEVSGKLSALTEQMQKRPTSRPASVVARIAAALADQ